MEDVRQTYIFERITKLKREILPEAKIYLFGSRARNEARDDSDWDLLILLDKKKVEYNDYGLYSYPFAELGWELDTDISAKIYTVDQWEKYNFFPFFKNVQKDGIEIV